MAVSEHRSANTGRETRGSCIVVCPFKRVFIILLGVLLVQHSCEALYSRGGRPGKLPAEDLRELTYRLITDFDIDEGTTYTPGVVQQVVVRCVSGLRYLIQLAVLNGATCSFGKGSESLGLPAGVVAGSALSEAYNDRLYTAVDQMMSQNNAWGYAIDDGVVLSYFQLDDPNLPENPDNDDGRRNELLEVDRQTLVGVPTPPVTSLKYFNATFIHESNLKNSSSVSKFPLYPWIRTDQNDCRLLSNLFTSKDDDYRSGGLHILKPGFSLYSPSKMFRLDMQFDCNLVLYNEFRSHSPLWASGTWRDGNNCYGKIQLDGVFGVFGDDGRNLWFTPNSRCDSDSCWSTVALQVQDDGNVVLYAIDKANNEILALWATGTVVCVGGCRQ